VVQISAKAGLGPPTCFFFASPGQNPNLGQPALSHSPNSGPLNPCLTPNLGQQLHVVDCAAGFLL
jgi:hypothetical protein